VATRQSDGSLPDLLTVIAIALTAYAASNIGHEAVGHGGACVILGGGRERKEDSVDPAVGIVVHKKIGDKVSVGESLCTIHCHSDAQAARAKTLLEESYQIAAAPPPNKPSLVHRVIHKGEH